MIHVAFCTSNLYAKFAGTAMLSLFENVPPPPNSVIVHILHDNSLTAENRDKFIYIAGMYGQIVNFYNVEKLCANRIAEFRNLMPEIDERLSIVTLYRLLIPQILSEDIIKIIYLDCDIIVNLNIAELWRVELNDKPIAAVTEKSNGCPSNFLKMCKDGLISFEDYFNSGVLIMNLRRLRVEISTITDGFKFLGKNPVYNLADQEILNYCFASQSLKLPNKFNRHLTFARRDGDFEVRDRILHYTANTLRLDAEDIFNRLWLKYFSKTPWFNESTLGNLYEGVKKIYVEQKNFAAQISALISGKTRAFFVAPNQIEAVRQIFYVKPNEEIIAADSPESLQRVANSLAARDKVFFVFLPNEYPIVQQNLSRAGFVEGADFLNAMLFLSDAHGVPLNSYPLIKLL